MKGIYVLVIKLNKDTSIKIGALGKIKFKKGIYAYVGSAQNNLEKRVLRHLSKNKKTHWHIDYFLKNKNTEVIEIFYKQAGKQEECSLAKKINKTSRPIPKFGCSDCKCKSHLFKITKSLSFFQHHF